MMSDITGSVISLLESDTIDSVLVLGHDPTCLKTLLGWGSSASDKRIFRLQKETPIVVPCILLQVTQEEDSGAPGSTEDLASIDVITFNIVASTGAEAKSIWTRMKDLMRVGPSDPTGLRIFLAKRITVTEIEDASSKTVRRIARYRFRSIESE